MSTPRFSRRRRVTKLVSSSAVNLVRTKVSQDRVRHKDAETGTNLDLTYITQRLVAMGLPASGKEALWRNHIDDVVHYFQTKHKNGYMIFNLSERQDYDYAKFDNQIVEYAFPDHHAPPLNMLFSIIWAIDSWLKADPSNIAVIHCLGGKGRTGTVVSCYLYYVRLFEEMGGAQAYYARQRSRIGKGVTQASQRRYLAYFGAVLNGKPITGTPLRLRSLLAGPFPPSPNSYQLLVLHYSSDPLNPTLLYASEPQISSSVLEFNKLSIPVNADILIRLMEIPTKKNDKTKELFHVLLNTAFVDNVQLRLRKCDLDGKINKGKNKKRFSESLTATLTFMPADDDGASEDQLDNGNDLWLTMMQRFQENKINQEQIATQHGISLEALRMYKNNDSQIMESEESTESGTTEGDKEESEESGQSGQSGQSEESHEVADILIQRSPRTLRSSRSSRAAAIFTI